MTELTKTLNEFAAETIRQAQLNLGATQPRWGIRAKWSNGKPSSFKRRRFMSRVVASDNLRTSMSYTTDDNSITFDMPEYGKYVETGTRGRIDAFGVGTLPNRKLPPKNVIDKWIKQRGIRPRDEKTHSFLPMTKGNMESMSFLMRRKIKWFGQAPTHFWSYALRDTMENFEGKFPDAITNDIVDKID